MTTTYNLYWSLTPGVTLLSNKIANVTSPYTHGGLLDNTTYYYAVTVNDVNGESSLSNELSATTLVGEPVADPATLQEHTSFQANWKSVPGATGYQLDVATDNAFAHFVIGFNNKDVGNVLDYSVTGLTQGTTYYYRVRAYNGNGASGNSNIITVYPLVPGGGAAPGSGHSGKPSIRKNGDVSGIVILMQVNDLLQKGDIE